ncbi:porin [Lampropedia aestuarii]|uniref:Porin n=2 Tax=Lampropedia aestuarii TaxID=2562762 RepID=A0A4S5BNL7_9BURK|nr:porin [Lampropedia aestuarii]
MFNLGVSAMKKSLIALAAIAASGLAMAQSSVTLYGVADIAVGDAYDKTGAQSNNNINNGNSRIGFRGVEDLGNGLKAEFQLEQAVRLADGSTGGNGGAGGATFARQAWVGLSGNFGAVRAGRQLTPTYDAVAVYDLTGTANYSPVALNFGYGGGSRTNSLFKYVTPSFGGFKASLGYVFEDNYTAYGANADGKSNAKGFYDIAVIYQNGPLGVSAAYNYAEVNSGWSKKSRVENSNIGATYDFGSFKLAGSYHYNDVASVSNYEGGPASGTTHIQPGIQGYSLGATVPLGAFSLTADVVYAKDRNELTPGAGKRDGVDAVIEAKYALSKRTFVYGVYYRADKKGPQFENTFGEQNNYAIGLRHNF